MGGEGICLSDPHSQPHPPQFSVQSLGSATLLAPAQGLILELLGGMEVSCFPFCPPCPQSFLRYPRQGEGGQDELEAPGRRQLPL